MAKQSKAKRTDRVKLEFVETPATTHGGAAILVPLFKRVRLAAHLTRHLRKRSDRAKYSAMDVAMSLIVGLLLGGRGLWAAEILRRDPVAAKFLGLEDRVPEEATMQRCMEGLAGLAARKMSEAYEPAGPALERLDMLGNPKKSAGRRRKKSPEPERAKEDAIASLRNLVAATARGCFQRLRRPFQRLGEFVCLFGDATDLEVRGDRFDAARRGRDGVLHMRWFTMMIGPILFEQELTPGNTDEGRHVPSMIERAGATLAALGVAARRRLALLDSAYCEKRVIEALAKAGIHFIVGANQYRRYFEKAATDRTDWFRTGSDAARGWADSFVCAFRHPLEGWETGGTVIARKWRETGEVEGVWHYSFLVTDLTPKLADVKPAKFAERVWQLYGTKQGRENHYKQLLSDFGLHHPPSGRMGVNQVFYALATVASNLAMVLRYRMLGEPLPELDPIEAVGAPENATRTVAPACGTPAPRRSKSHERDRGMSMGRVREMYFRVAATVVRSGRELVVRLMAGAMDVERRLGLQSAWTAAGMV